MKTTTKKNIVKSGAPVRASKDRHNKTTMAAKALLHGEAEGLTRAAIDRAMSGDMQALRLCLERLLPAVKEQPVVLNLPVMETAEDVGKVLAAIFAAVAGGKIPLSEGERLTALIDKQMKARKIAAKVLPRRYSAQDICFDVEFPALEFEPLLIGTSVGLPDAVSATPVKTPGQATENI